MRREDFTVGWICAVQTESVAACELLDEEYDSPTIGSLHDNNAYSFGRIGDHHIVIACLPKGRYGTVSAASVAKDMLRSFESIRIGLMVGIGGGAPSKKHDIRLGDVVVGCPMHRAGGVIPYNFGKAIQDKKLEQAGSLNSPPQFLLTALAKLSAHHERKGSQIAESVDEMVTKNPRLRAKYQRLGAEHDKLYESTYVHCGGDGGCEGHCDSASPPLLQRPQRDPSSEELVVHYGLIASADNLMKDAITRDQLIEEHDILCFEMEAAGLMNDFPCVVIRGICDYSDSHKNHRWQGYAAATAASYAKELLGIIPGHHIVGERTAIAEMVRPIFSVPYERDPNFIDRKEIFTQIEERLRRGHRASLCGIGGVGKTQIAIEYAYRFQKSQPQSHVFWVYAATIDTFLQAYRGIARGLKLPGCDDPEIDLCDLMLKWFKKDDHSWLMILDNADNAQLFFPTVGSNAPSTTSVETQIPLEHYLPSILSAQKSILITSRSRVLGKDLANGVSCVEAVPFSAQEAKDLLQLRLEGIDITLDKNSAERLLDILGYIPLAITQAAAFISRNRWNVKGYITAIESDKQNLMDHLSQELHDHRRPLGYPNSVFLTWKLSFDQILSQEPQAANLLSLIAMLDPKRIPESLLRSFVAKEVEFRMAIGTLDGFALITQHIGGEAFTIHPLVQASVCYWLRLEEEKESYESEALQLLSEEFPYGDLYEHREASESMLVHAQAVLQFKNLTDGSMKSRAKLLDKVALFHQQQGNYVSAHQEISEAYDIFREQNGEFATKTLSALINLAGTLRDLGKLEEAEKMSRRALQGNEKVHGSKHPETLRSVNGLATVFSLRRKYVLAEEMYRRALKGYEKLRGAEHYVILIVLDNLASVLSEQGQLEAAEKLHRQALEGREKVLGPEHPGTLNSVHNLGLVLQDQQKYKEAEEMARRALEGSEKVLGAEHPETLGSVNNLALVLQDQQKYKAAEEMARRALEEREKVLGAEHRDTLDSVHLLAHILDDQNRYDSAAALYQRAEAGFMKVLGLDHEDTQECSRNYAIMLDEMKGEQRGIRCSESESDVRTIREREENRAAIRRTIPSRPQDPTERKRKGEFH